jgi:Co/Zn/Cd efflux system component
MDPVMGIVGAVLVARWSIGLMRSSSTVLLDRRGPSGIRERIVQCIEADDDSRVADIHLWSIGPGVYAAEVSIVASSPCSVDDYKARLPEDLGLEHVTVETHACMASPLDGCVTGEARA